MKTSHYIKIGMACTGVSRSSLCDIEKGRQFVSIEMAVKIAKKCEVSQELAVEYVIRDAIRRSGLSYK